MNNFVEFPCPNCSSELNYDAEKSKLKCLHCASVFDIDKANVLIQETAFNNTTVTNNDGPLSSVTYRCSKCGKDNTTTNDIVFFECSNCGNNFINTQAYKQKAIHPSSILPFSVSRKQANEIFAQWIGKGFWNESGLKQLSLVENLKGHYIPFWTFDVQTVNEWNGQAGYYYQETEYYTDSEGRTQTRTVTHTRWEYHSGTLEHFFDDILICGNKEIAQERISDIYPYRLNELLPMDERYITGWNARNYSQSITESFAVAREYINREVYEMCRHELGGDTQQGLSVNTSLYDRTYKHIVLPVWLCEYLYKGKKYDFIINGQTGKIAGKKPLSATKIITAVIIIVIIIIIIYLMQQS